MVSLLETLCRLSNQRVRSQQYSGKDYSDVKERGIGAVSENDMRCLMDDKLSCPVSGGACIECGLFRGRHVHCSFFKRNIDLGLSHQEIVERRREKEKELTAEGVWAIQRTPKKSH